MKKTLSIGLIVLIVGLGNIFSEEKSLDKPFKNEPGGFRGIKWGTDISILSEMKYIEDDARFSGVKLYEKKKDDLNIGGVELTELRYGFWEGKFFYARGYFKAYDNFSLLEKVFRLRFGEPHTEGESNRMWFGKKGTVFITYYKESGIGVIFIRSSKLDKQREGELVREGTDKGF